MAGSLPLMGWALAGGTGSRLQPLTQTVGGEIRSKALVSFMGRPILARQLEAFAGQGLEACFVAARGRCNREPVRAYFGYRYHSVALQYSEAWADPLDRGSADATLRHAARWGIRRPLLIFPTDSLFDVQLADLYRFHRRVGADLTVAAMILPTRLVADRYGVMLHRSHWVTRFAEKPTRNQLRQWGRGPWASNGGLYLVDPAVLARLALEPEIMAMRQRRLDFGLDLLPWMVDHGYRVAIYRRVGVSDLGNRQAFLTAMRRQLAFAAAPPAGEAWPAPRIHPTAKVVRSLVGAGVTIGPYAEVVDSWIDADSAVGNHARVTGSHIGAGVWIGSAATVTDSIVADGARIESYPGRLTRVSGASGIGEEARVAAGVVLVGAVVEPGRLVLTAPPAVVGQARLGL